MHEKPEDVGGGGTHQPHPEPDKEPVKTEHSEPLLFRAEARAKRAVSAQAQRELPQLLQRTQARSLPQLQEQFEPLLEAEFTALQKAGMRVLPTANHLIDHISQEVAHDVRDPRALVLPRPAIRNQTGKPFTADGNVIISALHLIADVEYQTCHQGFVRVPKTDGGYGQRSAVFLDPSVYYAMGADHAKLIRALQNIYTLASHDLTGHGVIAFKSSGVIDTALRTRTACATERGGHFNGYEQWLVQAHLLTRQQVARKRPKTNETIGERAKLFQQTVRQNDTLQARQKKYLLAIYYDALAAIFGPSHAFVQQFKRANGLRWRRPPPITRSAEGAGATAGFSSDYFLNSDPMGRVLDLYIREKQSPIPQETRAPLRRWGAKLHSRYYPNPHPQFTGR